jgi:hypothetical protein
MAVERPNLKSTEQQHIPFPKELENICTGLVFWEDKKKTACVGALLVILAS